MITSLHREMAVFCPCLIWFEIVQKQTFRYLMLHFRRKAKQYDEWDCTAPKGTKMILEHLLNISVFKHCRQNGFKNATQNGYLFFFCFDSKFYVLRFAFRLIRVGSSLPEQYIKHGNFFHTLVTRCVGHANCELENSGCHINAKKEMENDMVLGDYFFFCKTTRLRADWRTS